MCISWLLFTTLRISPTKVWVKANLLKSQGLFSVFCQKCSSLLESTDPLVSRSSSPCINHLENAPRATIIIGILITFMFHSLFFIVYFQFPRKVEVFMLLFTFFHFYSVISRDSKVHNSASSLFFGSFIDNHYVWSSGRDKGIRLNLKIPVDFVRLILQDRFGVVYIPFFRIVKFQFLSQFPVDHLAHSVVPCLIL